MVRKRSTRGTSIVSFSCDTELAERFKRTVEEGERSEYLSNLLVQNIDRYIPNKNRSVMSLASYDSRGVVNAAYTSSGNTASRADNITCGSSGVWPLTDSDIRELKRRMNNIKD